MYAVPSSLPDLRPLSFSTDFRFLFCNRFTLKVGTTSTDVLASHSGSPAEVRSFPNANDEGEAWVRLNHARVVDFRQVDDSWKESPVDWTGHTLAEVAVQARAALRAVGGNLPRNPLRTEEPQYLSQRLLLPNAPVRTVRARPQPRRSAVPTVQDEDGFEPVVRRR